MNSLLGRAGVLLLLVGAPLAAAPARPGASVTVDGGTVPMAGDERGYRIGEGPMLHAAPAFPRPRHYARLPVNTAGTAHLAVIGVQFPDLPAPEAFSTAVARLSGGIEAYLSEVSRGSLTLDVIPLGADWITASHERAFYGADGGGVDDRNQPIYELAREALVAVDSQADFAPLDRDGDGVLEMGEAHLMIIQSGNDQAATSVADDIWSHRWWIYGGNTVVDGVRVSEHASPGEEVTAGYVMVARSDQLGVIVHELLHSFGAPDLYDVGTGGHIPVGFWSVMDVGLWLGSPSGSHPCRPGGYLEWDIDAEPSNGIQGWITPDPLHDGEHTIGALGAAGEEVHLVFTPIASEYFLLENRTCDGLDGALPEAGVLIYHIDTSEPVNNVESSPPFRVWLEDPGQRPYKRGAAYSQDDGPSQTAFTPATTPSSDSNRGQPTGIAVTAIGPTGLRMTFRLAGSTPVIPQDHLVVRPVPARAGGILSVVLPAGVASDGTLDLVDLQGRRLTSRRLFGGEVQLLFDLPAHPHHGVGVLSYRVGDRRFSTPVIIVP